MHIKYNKGYKEITTKIITIVIIILIAIGLVLELCFQYITAQREVGYLFWQIWADPC